MARVKYGRISLISIDPKLVTWNWRIRVIYVGTQSVLHPIRSDLCFLDPILSSLGELHEDLSIESVFFQDSVDRLKLYERISSTIVSKVTTLTHPISPWQFPQIGMALHRIWMDLQSLLPISPVETLQEDY